MSTNKTHIKRVKTAFVAVSGAICIGKTGVQKVSKRHPKRPQIIKLYQN